MELDGNESIQYLYFYLPSHLGYEMKPTHYSLHSSPFYRKSNFVPFHLISFDWLIQFHSVPPIIKYLNIAKLFEPFLLQNYYFMDRTEASNIAYHRTQIPIFYRLIQNSKQITGKTRFNLRIDKSAIE